MSYYKKFKDEIMRIDGSDTYSDAIDEFDLMHKMREGKGKCLCGKPIEKMYFIMHLPTNVEYIVGCECIKKINTEYKGKISSIDYLRKRTIINFIPLEGKTWLEVLQKNPNYIKWMFKKGIFEQKNKVSAGKHLANLMNL